MTQQKSRKHQTQTQPVAITSRYDEILQAVHECRYVKVEHITRLFYTWPSSKSHVNEILNKLCGGKDRQAGQYLYRFVLPDTRVGNPDRVYTLGGLGIKYLQEEDGIEVNWRFDANKIDSLSYNYLQHQLDITSFLIAAKLSSRENKANNRDPILHEAFTEYDLRPRREKVTIEVTTDNGTTKEEAIEVVPDLWLDFHFPTKKTSHVPILVEIDRGTEGLKKFKKKIKALLEFISGPGYKKMFGVRAVTIAFVVTAGTPNRLDSLLTWTGEVLKELQMKDYTDTFRFRRLLPAWETEHTTLFSDPAWFRPGDKKPLRLFS